MKHWKMKYELTLLNICNTIQYYTVLYCTCRWCEEEEGRGRSDARRLVPLRFPQVTTVMYHVLLEVKAF